MASSRRLPVSLLFFPFLFTLSHAATITVINRCSRTLWAAASPTWTFNVNPGTTGGRVWARTGCSFDAAGRGRCETGDCGGLLECRGYGQAPNTLAEYALNQFSNLDFFDISLVDGFNVPMDFSPTTGGCRGIRCAADIVGQDPCNVFKTDNYCCNSGSCTPTNYSRFFKERCPDAYSYPKDDATSTFTCRAGGNYRVVFCP
ncbi:unnamed protein product [Spirodela intermedia]|uniref:Uncharacterized protein n=1 Tax=Spirodela intermedia TaxID=51605 RepID=A0A7I8IJB7_SPIIN|nr:unnamed protein product [Spirodela intermedia]CAA6657985.1 unnamed protein product [Spirodela intermedia]